MIEVDRSLELGWRIVSAKAVTGGPPFSRIVVVLFTVSVYLGS